MAKIYCENWVKFSVLETQFHKNLRCVLLFGTLLFLVEIYLKLSCVLLNIKIVKVGVFNILNGFLKIAFAFVEQIFL